MEILGSVAVKDFFFDGLAELVLPYSQLLDRKNEEVEAPSDSRFQIAKHMDNFVKRAAQVKGLHLILFYFYDSNIGFY